MRINYLNALRLIQVDSVHIDCIISNFVGWHGL